MTRRSLISIIFIFCAVVVMAASKHRFTLVIDPGHGGHDVGAMGKFSKEKDINLRTALAFGKMVERNCSDVHVVYTRKSDIFVTLHGRAEIANKAKADLFISIHTNSLPGKKVARGLETYTLGMHRAADNLDVAKRENSVILVEKDYKKHYEGFDPNSSESYIIFEFLQDHNMAKSVELAKLVQSNVCSTANRPNKGVKQAGFLVLRETSMPSCLIELGFISTSDEEKYLNESANVDNMARGIYQAFVKYKNKYNGGSSPSSSKALAQTEEPQQQEPETEIKEVVNMLQIPPVVINENQVLAANSEARVEARPQPQSEVPSPRQNQNQAPAPSPQPRRESEQAKPVLQQAPVTQQAPQPRVEQAKPVQQQAPVAQQVPQPRVEQPKPVQQQAPVAQQAPQPRVEQAKPVQQQAPVAQQAPQPRVEQTKPVQQQAPVAQQTPQPKAEPTPAPKPAAQPAPAQQKSQQKAKASNAPVGAPVFMIQIFIAEKILDKTDARFKGENANFYKEGRVYKYTIGATTDYEEIVQLRKDMASKFPGCFIVAFKNGEKINTNDAVIEYKLNKAK